MEASRTLNGLRMFRGFLCLTRNDMENKGSAAAAEEECQKKNSMEIGKGCSSAASGTLLPHVHELNV